MSVLLDGGQRTESFGVSTSTSTGTTLTAHASTHTKGSYSELIASTAFDAAGFWIMTSELAANGRDFLIDLSVGSAGNEKVLLSNFCMKRAATKNMSRTYFPVTIPVGTRLSARCQSNIGSGQIIVGGLLVSQGGFSVGEGFGAIDTYGASAATSAGTDVDAGATPNTKGSWAEITASTTRDIKSLAFSCSVKDVAQAADAWFLIDIGIGAGGSEKVLIANWPLWVDGTEEPNYIQSYSSFPCHIPSGTRVAARVQATISDAGDRIVQLVLYGMA